MVAEVKMPALSPTMNEGKIVSWCKKEGDKVIVGDVILEVETDKALMEVEAQEKGTIGKIFSNENDIVEVGKVIALILEKGETQEDIKNYKLTENEDTENKQEAIENSNIIIDIQAEKEQLQHKENNSKVFISPLAKKIATINNIDYTNIAGTGPNGRIIKNDIEKLLHTNIHKNNNFVRNDIEYIDIEPNNMRKTIAKRLTESKQQIPHFYLRIKADMTNLVSFREEINKIAKTINGIPEYRISLNDIITLAVAKSLKLNENINAIFINDKIRKFNNIDISVAVSTEDGIYTPVIKNADNFDIITLSQKLKELIKKTREGKLAPNEYNGGCLTISNLGMYNVEEFSSIINPPQSCIIAIGCVDYMPFADKNGFCISKLGCNITFSADHRVIDGKELANFANDIKKMLENPALIFAL